mmetsp:Transcript_3514/g.7990  ORF Transcript_3514/g.7990 Transcript_3514/m.7990 type:complete len:224 (+) Transcript_3514:1719-2390(+)
MDFQIALPPSFCSRSSPITCPTNALLCCSTCSSRITSVPDCDSRSAPACTTCCSAKTCAIICATALNSASSLHSTPITFTSTACNWGSSNTLPSNRDTSAIVSLSSARFLIIFWVILVSSSSVSGCCSTCRVSSKRACCVSGAVDAFFRKAAACEVISLSSRIVLTTAVASSCVCTLRDSFSSVSLAMKAVCSVKALRMRVPNTAVTHTISRREESRMMRKRR